MPSTSGLLLYQIQGPDLLQCGQQLHYVGSATAGETRVCVDRWWRHEAANGSLSPLSASRDLPRRSLELAQTQATLCSPDP